MTRDGAVASITVVGVRQLGLAKGSEVTAVIKASDVPLAIPLIGPSVLASPTASVGRQLHRGRGL
jgi:hypothetical protein